MIIWPKVKIATVGILWIILLSPLYSNAQDHANFKLDSIRINAMIKRVVFGSADSLESVSYRDSLVHFSKQYPEYNYLKGLLALVKIRRATNSVDIQKNISIANTIFQNSSKAPTLTEYSNDSIIANIYLVASYRYLTMAEDYVLSLQIAQTYINQYSETQNYELLARFWNIIGEVHRNIENYRSANRAYKQAYSIAQKMKDPYIAPAINIGTVLLETDSIPEAISLYHSLLVHIDTKSPKNVRYKRYIYNRMAQYYLKLGQYSYAKRFIDLAKNENEKYQSVDLDIMLSKTLTEYYLLKKEYKNAIEIGKHALSMVSQENFYDKSGNEIPKLLAEAYEKTGDLENAFLVQKEFVKISSRRFNPDAVSKIIDYQESLVTKSQELEKQNLISNVKLQESELKKQQYINWIAVVSIIAFCVFILVLYRTNLYRKKVNKALRAKNRVILEQSEALKQSNEEVQTINNNLERLALERTKVVKDQNEQLKEYAFFNAHKIRGPLARILGLIKVMDYELPQKESKPFREMLKKASEELDLSISEINKILKEKGNQKGLESNRTKKQN